MRALERGWLVLAALGFAASFYVFARFTVDDAFISWAYGKNLATRGVWAYSVYEVEPVEAYTSIVYAALAGIPEALGIDVVLFFKLVSTLLLLYVVGDRVVRARGFSRAAAAALIATPLFVLHLYSGLETVLFGVVAFAAVHALHRDRPRTAVIIGTLGFFVRPEGLLLAGLCWITALVRAPRSRTIVVICACGGAIGLYLSFRLSEYAAWLPHAYYAKSRSFDAMTFVRGAWLLLPLPLMFRRDAGRAANLAVAVLLVLGLAEVTAYASSAPMMNYGERFFFHLYVPVVLFALIPANLDAIQSNLRLGAMATRVLLGAFFALTMARWSAGANLGHYATYYPRLLDSHVAIGEALATVRDDGSPELVFGDAGALAYAAEWGAIDNIGIASKAVDATYFTIQFLEQVQPELLIFHSEPVAGVRVRDYHQSTMWTFVQNHGYVHVCAAPWRSEYELALYASPTYLAAHAPLRTRLTDVCHASRAHNDRPDGEYLRATLRSSPFAYWHR